MPTKPQQFREKLLVVDFVAYGKHNTEFFFDSNYQQATEYIWSKLCPTANILFAWQYGLHEPIQITSGKKKLTDIELQTKYKQI